MSRYIDEISARENFQDVLAYMGSEVKRMLKKIPTADVVEVKHGEWIWDFNLDGDDFFRCSVCGRQEVINGLCRERNPIEEFPYCHCGAKMDGERREE